VRLVSVRLSWVGLVRLDYVRIVQVSSANVWYLSKVERFIRRGVLSDWKYTEIPYQTLHFNDTNLYFLLTLLLYQGLSVRCIIILSAVNQIR
jgi:hypothetical protein